MPAEKNKKSNYQTLTAPLKKGATNSHDQPTLKFSGSRTKENLPAGKLVEPHKKAANEIPPETILEEIKSVPAENILAAAISSPPAEEIPFAQQTKRKKKEKKAEKDRDLLNNEKWLTRNGHTLTYIGLYLFSILVFFRPYELVSGLSFLSTSAFIFALATLAVYLPTQLSTEGSLTMFSTEVKCVLALTLIALVTMPIAKDPPLAWTTFNETFIKAVVMFIVMVNVLRTRRRLMGLIWLSLAVGIYLSYTAVDLYMKGEFKVEGYRVGVEVAGLFGNPNDMALHLVTMTPIAVALGFGSRRKLMRVVYFMMAGLFIAANMVTFSRGGFLGLIAVGAVLAWKLGRGNRFNISLASMVVSGAFILFAPGNYGLRILSIFIPSLDPVGSNGQRREILERSIIVTLRNPWGIGIGNFPIVGFNNLVSHNAFTQVSSELGVLGLLVYLIFMISPFRKLGAIERTLFDKNERNWFYYMAIGLQASIVGYMTSSFFVSVAYNWFVYYLIGYAVAFRRIYKIEKGIEESEKDVFGLPTV
ncbi:MAG: O-antigen ligase family protein [Pyrinomonadaceae bacterium]|nr:O-antigen ligase family protein [Pyrinomonadaceae bacterium]